MRIMIVISLILAMGSLVQAQDEIKGVWITQESNSKIEIYEIEGQYFGKVVWLEEPYDRKGNPKKDMNNPDKALRGREIMGSDLLTALTYRDGAWKGKIYVARNGRTMDVVLRAPEANQLELEVSFRGFSRVKKWLRDSI